VRLAVVVFPGSNCDRDAIHAARLAGAEAYAVWHEDPDLRGADVVVLPGGFAYGDYLRAGALARFSPVMRAVGAHAEQGGLVLGICNGFQVLAEAGLVPGALLRNRSLRFEHRWVRLEVERRDTPFTSAIPVDAMLRLPIAHGEGCYFLPDDELARLEAAGQVVFRYAGPEGNPNGSVADIAGVVNAGGNVCGLMPHPERASETLLGSDDGMLIFRSLVDAVARAHLATAGSATRAGTAGSRSPSLADVVPA
jgi:phosphoribosylformylglycinamidine synthase subunit PurQ / glutaminase